MTGRSLLTSIWPPPIACRSLVIAVISPAGDERKTPKLPSRRVSGAEADHAVMKMLASRGSGDFLGAPTAQRPTNPSPADEVALGRRVASRWVSLLRFLGRWRCSRSRVAWMRI
jgi:hypothetical protein